MPFTRVMNFDVMNEADVRAEVIDPWLRGLGYQAGTENNIVREGALRYERAFLGRKKTTDPVLRGRPDYVLEVGTHGRWLLEAKGPNAHLTIDDFEQAQSYALHPNVAASLCVITNGRRFLIYQATAANFDDRLFEFEYISASGLEAQIRSLLSPAGFRRAVRKVQFDTALPVADTYPARLRLGPGVARPKEARSSVPLPDAGMRALANVQTPLPQGICARDEHGRLYVEVEMGASNQFTDDLLKKRGLDRVRLHSDSRFLPISPAEPVLFTGDFRLDTEAGDKLMDITSWQPVSVPFATRCYARIDATGRIEGRALVGKYALHMYFEIPAMGLKIDVQQLGDFELGVMD